MHDRADHTAGHASARALEGIGAWRSAALRDDWVALVRGLHEASLPGGALEGWLFHGTTGDRAAAISEEGMTTTDVDLEDRDTGEWFACDGTYWATAAIAARYAEDRAEAAGDDTLELAIVACRREDLECEGEVVADVRSIEWPLAACIDGGAGAVREAWEASARSADDSLRLVGAAVCLSPVGPEFVEVLATEADLRRVLREAAALPAPR